MTIFQEYVFPAASNNNIALLQLPVGGINFILNGSLVNTKGTINFKDDYGFVPRITATCANDISTRNIVIEGKQNGIYIVDSFTAPTAGATVISNFCFDEIYKIYMDGVIVRTVSIGTSGVGYFPLIRLNTLKRDVPNLNYALNMMVAAANPATYQVFLSLKDSYNQGTYDSLTAANNNFIAPAVAANASALLQYTQLASNILIKVTPNANGTILKAQFMQL